MNTGACLKMSDFVCFWIETLFITQYLLERCCPLKITFYMLLTWVTFHLKRLLVESLTPLQSEDIAFMSVTRTRTTTPWLVLTAPQSNRRLATDRDICWQRIWDPHCSVARNMSALQWPRASHETYFLSASLNRPTPHRIVPAWTMLLLWTSWTCRWLGRRPTWTSPD